MSYTLLLAIVMATLGQIILSVSVLLPRASVNPVYWSLIVFLVASGLMVAAPVSIVFIPKGYTLALAIMPLAYLLQAPALWLYVQGLTSPVPWQYKPVHCWHLLPLGFGFVTCGLLLSLPATVRYNLFIAEQPVNSAAADVASLFVLITLLLWLGQSGFYLIKSIRHLSLYRRRLKDLFSSNEHRELGWLSALLLSVACIWSVAMVIIVLGVLQITVDISHTGLASLYGVFMWVVATWGLRQKPGFTGRYQSSLSALEPTAIIESASESTLELMPESMAESMPEQVPAKAPSLQSASSHPEKYQRSALGQEQAARIAQKLEAAMQEQQLYLDSALSLQKLAQHLTIPANYISQTLNNTLGQNFFDYVNRWRIDHAQQLVLNTDMSITDIAYASGFNARSSFYKAFKQALGCTPSVLRKANADGFLS